MSKKHPDACWLRPCCGNLCLYNVLFFKRDHNVLKIYTMNMYLLNEIKHYVHILRHGNYIEIIHMYSIICLKLLFLEITNKYFWLSGRVIFEGSAGQSTCWL